MHCFYLPEESIYMIKYKNTVVRLNLIENAGELNIYNRDFY